MKTQNQTSLTFESLEAKRERDMKQNITTITDLLDSIKNNPKFIKLLIFSMNSLENFISPPNRKIKANSKIIIKYDGISNLKLIAQTNILNDEVVEKAGDIVWKCISLNDVMDNELAKQFAEVSGHEFVIEILLSKEKGKSSKPYIKILNGLVHIPQLLQKLIESGLIETVKLINDLYFDDLDSISVNLDTLKKITNLKVGREIILKKNLIKNIFKNIKSAAKYKKPEIILTGLQILDNLSRNDEGIISLKQNDAINNISYITDLFPNNSEILDLTSKIYSKISTVDDMNEQIDSLKEIQNKAEYTDLNKLQKALVLISNFMLVEDIEEVLLQEDNLELLKKLFNDISNLNINGNDTEFLEDYLIVNKYFMVIFKRLHSHIPKFSEDENIKENLNKNLLKNYQALKELKSLSSKAENNITKNLLEIFSSFFSAFADFFEIIYESKSPEENLIMDILDIILNEASFSEIEKLNYSASRILKIANKTKTKKICEKMEDLFNFMISTIQHTGNENTLENIFEILMEYLNSLYIVNFIKEIVIENAGMFLHGAPLKEKRLKGFEKYTERRNILLDIVLEFMNQKPKYRRPNLYTMKILSHAINDNYFLESFLKTNKIENLYIPTISVMAKHIYETSNVFSTVSLGGDKDNQILLDDLEKQISNEGVKILEKLVSQQEIQKLIKNLKESITNFDPAKITPEKIEFLEFNLLFIFCVMKVKSFFNMDLKGIIESLSLILRKEVKYIEFYKREKSGNSKATKEEVEEINDNIKSFSKRILLQIGILKLIFNNLIKFYEQEKSKNEEEENENNTKCDKFIEFAKDILKIYLEFFEKSNDIDNILNILGNLLKNSVFLSDQEIELNKNENILEEKNDSLLKNKMNSALAGKLNNNNKTNSNESLLDKITINLVNLLRKNLEYELICSLICSILLNFAKKRLTICDILVKAGCPRLLLSIMDNSSDSELAQIALELIKLLIISSDENLMMISNQNIFETIFEINTKYFNNQKIKHLCDLITNQLMKLPNQEEIINSLINNSIKDFNEYINNDKDFENVKQSQILNTIEKINSFIPENKINPKILEKNFIENLLKLFELIIQDKEFSDTNERLFNNVLSLFKRIQIGKGFYIEENSEKFGKYLLLLTESIKFKSQYRDFYINSLKEISEHLYKKETYEKFLKDLIDNEFINYIFLSIENYYEDQIVNREINNTLCAICINSEELGKYIVEKGGAANILNELKFLLKKDDPVSESIKFSSWRFIDTLVKENSTMETFLELKGADLIQKYINKHFEENEEKKNKGSFLNLKREKTPIEYYLTKSTINLTKEKQKDILNENSNKFNQQKEEMFLEEQNSKKEKRIDKGKGLNLLKKTSFFGNIMGLGDTNSILNEENSTTEKPNKKINIFKKLISKSMKKKKESPQYLVYCIKIIDTNIKQGRKDFNDPKLFRTIMKLIKKNFPNLVLFNKGIDFLSNIYSLNEDLNLTEKEKRKIVQMILSNFANFQNCPELIFSASPLIQGIQYEDKNLLQVIKLATKLNEIENDNSIEINSKATPRIKSRFLTYLSLYVEHELNLLNPNSNAEIKKELYSEILNYFNSIMKLLTDIENNDKIPFLNEQGFSLSLLKIRIFLEKKKLINIKDDYYTEKIFNSAKKFFNEENSIFSEKILDDFNQIYENLYQIKTTTDKDLILFGDIYPNRQKFFIENISEENKSDYLEDYYGFNNLIAEYSFKFFDAFNDKISNVMDKITPKFLNVLLKITNNISNYAVNCNENNAIRENYLSKFSNYIMTFILNERLNEEKNQNELIANMYKKFWEFLKNLIEIDEKNEICSNDLLLFSLIEKLNAEILIDPFNKNLRKIYYLISLKVENKIEILEKIIDFSKNEICGFKPNEENENNKIDILFNINSSLELLSNISKFNISARLIEKNMNLLTTLKNLYLNFDEEFKTFKEIEDYKGLKILNKTNNLLMNILYSILSNRSNMEKLILDNSDILKKLTNELAETNFSDLISNENKIISELNLNSKGNLNVKFAENPENNSKKYLLSDSFKKGANILLSLVKDNFKILSGEDLNILDTNIIKKILENLNSEETISNEYRDLIENITAKVTEKQMEEKILNNQKEIEEIFDKINYLYEKHIELLTVYKQTLFSFKQEEEKSQRNMTLGNATLATLANISSNSTKKMSIISRNILFSLKDQKFKSPISATYNEEILSMLEKIMNFMIRLFDENKNEKNEKFVALRNPLISKLLNSVKLLSITPDNHVQILELGLLSFMERLLESKEINEENFNKNIETYLETLDLAKNCTSTELAIPFFISSPITEIIISDIFEMYNRPEIISKDSNMKSKFKSCNRIFSNICKVQKGFKYIFDKMGMDKLLELAKKTYNDQILEAVLNMILSYITNDKQEISSNFSEDVLLIIIKSFKVYSSNREDLELIIGALSVLGNIANENTIERINHYNLTAILMKFEIKEMMKNKQFFEILLFSLGKICYYNNTIGNKILECGLIKMIKENLTPEKIKDLSLIENLTMLFANLLKNNRTMPQSFIANDLIILLFQIIEKNLFQKDAEGENKCNKILQNILLCFDFMTLDEKTIEFLSLTKFNLLMNEVISIKLNELDLMKISLRLLGNYLQREIGSNVKTLHFDTLLENLMIVQKKYYSNSDILIYINYIASYLITYKKEYSEKENLLKLILVPVKAQDWNEPLIISSTKIIYEIFQENKELQENVFTEVSPSLFNLLKIHNVSANFEVLYNTYRIMSLYSKVYFRGIEMVCDDILNIIKDTFDLLQRTSQKNKLHWDLNDMLFDIVNLLILDFNNKKKACSIFIGKFITDLKNEDPKNITGSVEKIIDFFYSVFEIKEKRSEFMQFSGIEALLPILKENVTNISMIKNSFKLMSRLINDEDDFKKILKNLKVVEFVDEMLLNPLIKKDKEFSLLAQILINDLNEMSKFGFAEMDYIPDQILVTIKDGLAPEIRNFMISGRMIRLIDEKGSKTSVLLIMTKDLMNIMAKKVGSKEAPKDKYIIDVTEIKKISRGYSNDSFKKSVGFFSNVFGRYPEPNRCFSISSSSSMSNKKTFNVKCSTVDECSKWINYLTEVIKYLKKTKAIENTIQFE